MAADSAAASCGKFQQKPIASSAIIVAPANATVKSGSASVLAPRQASDRCNSTATNEMPKPRLNCCAMLATLLTVLIWLCSTSA